jgi:hypothetical protein
MRRLAFVVAVVLAAACGSGHTGGGAASPSASTHAAGRTITADQQLQSSVQLRSELNALTCGATEGDLLKAVTAFQKDYQAVAGSTGASDDADWQQALTKLRQALDGVQQVANANSSNPDGPNPLKSGCTSVASPAPAAPPKPRGETGDVIKALKDGGDALTNMITHIGFAITINNLLQPTGAPDGIVHAQSHQGGPYPEIECGLVWNGTVGTTYDSCAAYVLALQVVALSFDPARPNGRPYGIGSIDGCNASWNSRSPSKPPGSDAVCNISGAAGKTVTITPHWVATPQG